MHSHTETPIIVFPGRVRILAQVTIYRRLWIGRDGHLDQSEAVAYIVTSTRIRREW